MMRNHAPRYLLLGSNIAKSISPAVQNAALRKTGLKARYELFQIPLGEFDSAMKEILDSDDVRGLNITAPYKEDVIPYLSKLDSRSKSIGAVNTVKKSGKKMEGYNTDVDGILATLGRLGALKRRGKCVLLGAGGAARACSYTVLKSGYSSLVILNRTRERAEMLRSDLRRLFSKSSILVEMFGMEEFAKEIKDTDLVINAVTSPFPIKVDFVSAPKSMRFFDLGYKEPSSILIQARAAGIKSMDGVSMLVEQGAKSFEIWTGREAPRRTMLLAARKELASRAL
jgi:shikimate dehydrogenase